MPKVILYVAASKDGFIADINGGVDWLPQPTDGEDCGYQAMLDDIDIIIMGSKSYLQILTFGDWAWAGKKTYVFTSQNLKTDRDDIFFVNRGVKDFMDMVRAQNPSKNIWLLGGAELVRSFAQDNLIDESIITLIPVNLEIGIKLDQGSLKVDLLDCEELK